MTKKIKSSFLNRGSNKLFLIIVSIFLITFLISINGILRNNLSYKTRASTSNPNLNYIIGGTEVKLGEFPFMAVLYYKDKFKVETIKGSRTAGTTINQNMSDSFFCGGSLIAPQYILTAAHCVQKYKDHPEKIGIALNFTNLKDSSLLNKTFVGINQIIIHKNYASDGGFSYAYNDIALLRLDRRLANSTLSWSNNQS